MPPPPPVVPRVIGRYALYDAIASGGMATVHLGRVVGAVGFARMVAIKRLHPHLAADPGIVAMLIDEAHLVARIRHPNVVPTLDAVSEGREVFLVMEYVHGESLARLTLTHAEEDTRIRPDVVATILVGILHGLHAAHEAQDEAGDLLGIVHRDVSPQNILVGVDGVPRLVDFGVAKAARRVGEATQDGQLKGKLAYMAPEQIRGTTDRTTDVYAASVVLWEALTGKRLFMGATHMDVFNKVMRGDVPPPSSVVPGLPGILDEVTLRGLHRDPKERYATARDMARRLEETMPLVAASRIGEWVERTAGNALHARTRRVLSIERDAGMHNATIRDVKKEPVVEAEPWPAGPPTTRSAPVPLPDPEEPPPTTQVGDTHGDPGVDARVHPVLVVESPVVAAPPTRRDPGRDAVGAEPAFAASPPTQASSAITAARAHAVHPSASSVEPISAQPGSVRRPRRTAAVVAGLAAVVVLGSSMLLAAITRRPPIAASTSPANGAPAPSLADVARGAATPSGALHATTVTLAVTPATAKVTLAGSTADLNDAFWAVPTAKGMLELRVERPMALDVSAPGYATTRISVDGTESLLRIDLEPLPQRKAH